MVHAPGLKVAGRFYAVAPDGEAMWPRPDVTVQDHRATK